MRLDRGVAGVGTIAAAAAGGQLVEIAAAVLAQLSPPQLAAPSRRDAVGAGGDGRARRRGDDRGRYMRFDLTDVKAWLEGCKQPGRLINLRVERRG